MQGTGVVGGRGRWGYVRPRPWLAPCSGGGKLMVVCVPRRRGGWAARDPTVCLCGVTTGVAGSPASQPRDGTGTPHRADVVPLPVQGRSTRGELCTRRRRGARAPKNVENPTLNFCLGTHSAHMLLKARVVAHKAAPSVRVTSPSAVTRKAARQGHLLAPPRSGTRRALPE